MKSGATARYAFDTGMAASQKQLTIDLGQKFRTAALGFHNADTALLVDQATATGNFSLAQANKQLAGAEKLHLELDLPYTQFLVDRATADADYAAEARQLLIGHALDLNDAVNLHLPSVHPPSNSRVKTSLLASGRQRPSFARKWVCQ